MGSEIVTGTCKREPFSLLLYKLQVRLNIKYSYSPRMEVIFAVWILFESPRSRNFCVIWELVLLFPFFFLSIALQTGHNIPASVCNGCRICRDSEWAEDWFLLSVLRPMCFFLILFWINFFLFLVHYYQEVLLFFKLVFAAWSGHTYLWFQYSWGRGRRRRISTWVRATQWGPIPENEAKQQQQQKSLQW